MTTINPEINETVKQGYNNDRILFEKILRKSREIAKKNKTQFLDKDFCENLSIIYTKKIYELPMTSITRLYNKIEGSTPITDELENTLLMTLKYDSLKEEKFLVSELSGKIVENFREKKIPTEVIRNGVKITLPDIYYINNEVLKLLDIIKKKEDIKLQNGGVFFHELALSNNDDNRENDRNGVNDKNGKMNSNSLTNKKIKIGGDHISRFSSMNPNNNEENTYYNNDESRINFLKKKSIKPDQPERIIRNDNPIIMNDNGNGKNKKGITTIPSQNSKVSISQIRKQLQEIKNKKLEPTTTILNVLEPVSVSAPEITSPVSVNSATTIAAVPQINTTKYMEDKHCIDPTAQCKLTKAEMCEKIITHFIIRNNLIAAIVSTIPLPDDNGDYKGGFTFERINSLKNGRFCVPSPFYKIDQADDNVRIEKILKFLNILDENECRKSGGIIHIIKENQMREMLADESFGKKYFEYGNKINIVYQESLNTLYLLLEKLESNISLSTVSLNQISLAVKNVIDELYIKTQFNFLLAVLVVLDFDFLKSSTKTKTKAERMKKIIDGKFI